MLASEKDTASTSDSSSSNTMTYVYIAIATVGAVIICAVTFALIGIGVFVYFKFFKKSSNQRKDPWAVNTSIGHLRSRVSSNYTHWDKWRDYEDETDDSWDY